MHLSPNKTRSLLRATIAIAPNADVYSLVEVCGLF